MSEINSYTQQGHAGEPAPAPKKEKSLIVSYILTFCLGWFGVHRFYLGNVLMGLMYLFSFGGLGLGVLIDLVFMRRIVAKANARRSKPTEEILLDEADIVPNRDLDPFGSKFFAFRWMRYFFFIIILAIAPKMLYSFFGDLTFACILFLLYIVVVYNKFIAGLVGNQEFVLWKIPGIRSRMLIIVNGFSQLRRFYASRPRIGTLRSWFSIFLVPFSAEVRKEWKLFNGLLAFGMIFVIFQFAGWGYEYVTVYQPQLNLWHLLQTKLVVMAVSAMFTLLLVIPVVRTLTYVELAGDVKKGRWFVILAIAVAIFLPFNAGTENYPFEDYSRLKLRLSSSKPFQEKFKPFIKSFMQEHYKPNQFSIRVTDDGKKSSVNRLERTRLALSSSIRLTRKLRQQLVKQKIVIRSEANGLRVLAFDAKTKAGWRSGLLVYAGYGESESKTKDKGKEKVEVLEWHRLQTQQGLIHRKEFVSVKEVQSMYRVLLKRMEAMKKGDQLSPDYKGKTPEFKGDKPSSKKPQTRRLAPKKEKRRLAPKRSKRGKASRKVIPTKKTSRKKRR